MKRFPDEYSFAESINYKSGKRRMGSFKSHGSGWNQELGRSTYWSEKLDIFQIRTTILMLIIDIGKRNKLAKKVAVESIDSYGMKLHLTMIFKASQILPMRKTS